MSTEYTDRDLEGTIIYLTNELKLERSQLFKVKYINSDRAGNPRDTHAYARLISCIDCLDIAIKALQAFKVCRTNSTEQEGE